MDESINIEDLISEIESRTVIWNSASEEYSNKILKRNAWEEVILRFVPNFKEKTSAEKNEIVLRFQRKWKSLRDSYGRELLRLKKEKSGSGAPTGRKQYTYFDQLRFLEISSKETKSNLEEEGGQPEENAEGDPEEENAAGDRDPLLKRKRSVKSKKLLEEDELYTILKSRVCAGATKPNESQDEDTLFMLSLVPELKKCPEAIKLDIKSDLINVFKRAKQQYVTSSYTTIPSNDYSFSQSLPHYSPQQFGFYPMRNPSTNEFNFHPQSNLLPSQGPQTSPSVSSSLRQLPAGDATTYQPNHPSTSTRPSPYTRPSPAVSYYSASSSECSFIDLSDHLPQNNM